MSNQAAAGPFGKATQCLYSLLRTWHTLRHLKVTQLFYYVLRRRVGYARAGVWQKTLTLRSGAVMGAPATRTVYRPAEKHVSLTFLNHLELFSLEDMQWHPTQVNRLWRYNLHYFDYLADPSYPTTTKLTLIDDWILQNPEGTQTAWEPYTSSLRIVNWCKFFASLDTLTDTYAQLASLYQQTLWLEKNLEHHILANHFFENIKALIFAGIFFDDANSARWLSFAQRHLNDQLREQTLGDGGHYERSPMYHCVMLCDYLDLWDLAQRTGGALSAQTMNTLSATIMGALAFLNAIKTPDDSIPLFNDSAEGTTPAPSAILRRAALQGFTTPPQGPLIDCAETGLYGWRHSGDYFLIDCGDIGPGYQPGHTHCDFLSYTLMLDGLWLIVDTGVCEYESGAMRHYVRSTAAHNTVSIADQEQSEVWGEFRVARRAHRLQADIRYQGQEVVFDGAFLGFPRVRGGIEHRRRVALSLDETKSIRQLAIDDHIKGNGNFPVRSLIHLHPAVTVRIDAERIVLFRDSVEMAAITTRGVNSITAESGWYCPQFGIKQPNDVLVLERSGPLPVQFGYTITKVVRAEER